MKKKIAVIGLGYVGLPLAVEFAKNRLVVGFDIKTSRIKELTEGHDPTLEVSDEDLKAVLVPLSPCPPVPLSLNNNTKTKNIK